MPSDACVFFWDCAGGGARLKPKAGDCCVFCSYGSAPCPPRQVSALAINSTCTGSRESCGGT